MPQWQGIRWVKLSTTAMDANVRPWSLNERMRTGGQALAEERSAQTTCNTLNARTFSRAGFVCQQSAHNRQSFRALGMSARASLKLYKQAIDRCGGHAKRSSVGRVFSKAGANLAMSLPWRSSASAKFSGRSGSTSMRFEPNCGTKTHDESLLRNQGYSAHPKF